MPNLEGLIKGVGIEEKPEINLEGLESINTQVNISGLERTETAGEFEMPDEPIQKETFADGVLNTIKDKVAKIGLAAQVAKTVIPKTIEAGRIDYTEAQPAFKYGAMTKIMGMPETLETINKAENLSWADVITESNPEYYDTAKGTPTKTFFKHLAPELGGEILETFSKPSTFITWKAIETVLPVLLNKLSQNPIFKAEVIKSGTKLDNLLRKIFFEPAQNIFKESPKTSYQELGLKENATIDEVRAAWTKRAFETHPDKNPKNPIQATQRFVRARTAYEKILSERGVEAGAVEVAKTRLPEAKAKQLIPAKKAKVIRSLVELAPEEKAATELMKVAIQEGEAGQRLPAETREWIGIESSFPVYFKNKGYTKKQTLDIIDKVLAGKPITEKQKVIYNDLLEGAQQEYQKEIDHYVREEERAKLEAKGLNESEIEETLRSADEEAARRAEVEDVTSLEEKLFGEPLETPYEKKASLAPANFIDELGRWIAPEIGINLPNKAIVENISGFKAAVGKEFVRYYGLTPEARQAFVKLTESNEPRQDDIIDFIKKNLVMSDQDASVLTYHLENPNKYPIPDNLKPQAEIINKTFDSLFQQLKARKLLSEKFPESFISSLREDIVAEQEALTLAETQGVGDKKKHLAKIKEYEDKIAYLQTLRYVPHRYRPIAEAIVMNLFKQGRVSSKVVSAVSKIKGRKIATLDEAKKAGLIPVDDIRILVGSYTDYVLKKIAIHDFIESLKKNPEVILKEKKAPEDWKKINLSQLDGFKVHPYMAEALRQYAISPPERGLILGAYDSINRLAKTILFYNPWIMAINDLSQSYLAGAINIHTPKRMWAAVKDLTQKTPFYKQCQEKGLFSSPFNSRPPIEEQIHLCIEEMSTRFPWVKTLVKTAINPARLYSEIQKITWGLDRIQRLSTVKYFLEKGLPLQKAVDRTNLFMVDYIFIPDQLRTGLNRVFLTPTYRSQMMRLYANLVKYPIKNKSAIARLIGFHIAISLWAAYAGYKRENLYRFVKKLDNPIQTPKGTVLSEQVIVGAGPLFEYNKIFGRAFSKTLYLNLARVPYLAVSLQKNREWKSDPIYDNGLPLEDKALQIVGYIIKTYFAPIEAFDRLGSEQQTALEKAANALAIPVYKRQSSLIYYMGQIRKIQGDVRDYMRRHPNASEEEIQKIYNEAQKRMDKLLKKIGESERAE